MSRSRRPASSPSSQPAPTAPNQAPNVTCFDKEVAVWIRAWLPGASRTATAKTTKTPTVAQVTFRRAACAAAIDVARTARQAIAPTHAQDRSSTRWGDAVDAARLTVVV